jgi:hypothetical protein
MIAFAPHRPRLIVAISAILLGLGAGLAAHLLGPTKADDSNEPHAVESRSQRPKPATNERQETIVIRGDVHHVRKVLLQVTQIAQWNPAFLSIAGSSTARIGDPHPIQVRGGLSGHFQYDAIDRERIESSWQVPGLRETNYWQLSATNEHSTTVTHGFTQTGQLAALLRNATRGVTELRLTRLKARVEAETDPR